MSGWRTGTLGEACKISTGFAFKGNEYEPTGNLRVVRGENVTVGALRWDSEKHWNRSLENLKDYFLKENDIVVGMDGSRVGQNRAKIQATDLPLILAQRVARIRAKSGFDQDFIWHQIFDNRFKDYIEAIHTGTSIPHISMTQIGDYEITVPPLPEQKAIAAVLSSLDDKIDLLCRQNQTLEAMAAALYRQWFVEEAREGWEKGILGDVVDFNYGKTLKDQERSGSGYPVIGSSGVVGFHKEFLVEAPGIVTGRKGTLGVVNYLFDNFFPIDTTFYITSKIKHEGLFYEYFLLKSVGLDDMNSDSAVPGLNRNAAHAIPVTIPPSELVKSFNDFCKSTFAKIKENRTQIQTLEKLRDTLLPKLMSGEVRVS